MKKEMLLLLELVSKMEFYSNFSDGIVKTECYSTENECSVSCEYEFKDGKNDGFYSLPIYDLKKLEVFETENTHTRIYISQDKIEFLVLKQD